MPLSSLEDMVLRYVASAASVPSKTVADIERDLPTLARLCNNAKLLNPIISEAVPIIKKLIPRLQALGDAPVKEALPMLNDLEPLIDQLVPLYQQAMVIITPEESDMAQVAPLIQELMDFFSKKSGLDVVSGAPVINMTPQE
jgi:hypothetical protein